MFDFSPLLTAEGLISLLTLSVLEIVLGIDNIIFISILADRLPPDQQQKARTTGIALALLVRIFLLMGIAWLASLTQDLFTVAGMGFSGRDVILFIGGLFLLYKATTEIHNKLEGEEEDVSPAARRLNFRSAVIQIILIDIVFSFDSILTAVGLVDEIIIMIIAVVIALTVMLIFAGKISGYINNHPTIKMLALAFLVMIGVLLIAEAFEFHVPKGYVYFSMAFSLGVEMLNLRMSKGRPVRLKTPYAEGAEIEEKNNSNGTAKHVPVKEDGRR
jgi:predicted tellurium resistance membrane protein TerC